ncbi:MAG TPA: lysophospholipid acyltransferase family protein [Burkholderiales bacterium]|nr:lysophospholipid acyltransferase family protein [Burkholderiales bacterium]
MKKWSRHLMRVLGLRVQVIGSPCSLHNVRVVVGNHVSWLDIFLIYTETPGLFVAKSEIRNWPVIGGLIDRVGTLFIERGSPQHARKINSQIVETISAGRVMCLFPEGATTWGDSVLPFHAALFQPAIEARAKLLPVALRYKTGDGQLCTAASYAGETTLIQSLWRIVSQRNIVAELHFLDPIDAAESDRRELAAQLESMIAERLSIPVIRRHIGTPADPPDE